MSRKKPAAPLLPEPLLTPEEVAVRLGVGYQVLAQWRHRKQGPKFLKVSYHGKRPVVRYRVSDVEAFESEPAKIV